MLLIYNNKKGDFKMKKSILFLVLLSMPFFAAAQIAPIKPIKPITPIGATDCEQVLICDEEGDNCNWVLSCN